MAGCYTGRVTIEGSNLGKFLRASQKIQDIDKYEILHTLEDNNDLLFMLRLRVSSMEAKVTSMQSSINELTYLLRQSPMYSLQSPSPCVTQSPIVSPVISLPQSPAVSPPWSPEYQANTPEGAITLPWKSLEYRPSTSKEHPDCLMLYPERVGRNAIQKLEDFLHNFKF